MVEQAAWPTATTLKDHWQWRPEWAIERPCLMWYLTFENQPELHELATRAQSCLQGVETVDLVPPQWLHLTLDDVGFVDEMPLARFDDVLESARVGMEGWEVPSMTLGPVDTMADALVLRAAPEDELGLLRARLRSSTVTALGAKASSGPATFWPHVTLAYINHACDRRTVMEPLAAVSSDEVVVARPQLALAAVTRRDRHYQW